MHLGGKFVSIRFENFLGTGTQHQTAFSNIGGAVLVKSNG
jgi:hypothetical protein